MEDTMSDKPTTGSSNQNQSQKQGSNSSAQAQQSKDQLTEKQKWSDSAQADAGDRSLDDEGPTMGSSKSSAKKQ
jgi:hypothetical protein